MKDRFQIIRSEEGGEGSGGGGGSTLLGGGGESQQSQQQGQQQQQNPGSSDAFDFRTLVGEDGKFVQGYHDKLPEKFREHATHFSKYGTPLQVLEHTLNLQQLLGSKANAVVIPGEGATPEQVATFREKLGVPELPSGYNIQKPDKLPEGVEWSQERVDSFTKLAHEISLTPQQVAKLQEFDLNGQASQAQGFKEKLLHIEQTELSKQSERLTKEWGNGPDFTKKKELAERAAITAGFSPEDLGANPIFRNADVVMAFARIGALMSEDTLAKGAAAGGYNNSQSEADDIIKNPNNPLHARYWKGEEDVVRMVQSKLQKR